MTKIKNSKITFKGVYLVQNFMLNTVVLSELLKKCDWWSKMH